VNKPSYFHQQLQLVRDDLLKMAELAEEAIGAAGAALAKGDADLAQKVIDGDRRIDILQNRIEHRCITLLATQQPVAVDLRFLSAAIKVCAQLERIGDHAKKVSKATLRLMGLPSMAAPANLLSMAALAREMTRVCVGAMSMGDAEAALRVIGMDDDLDSLEQLLRKDLIQRMAQDTGIISAGVEYILAARHFERIGDEATNIAEEVVFQIEGRVIRHQDEMEDECEVSAPCAPR
jgi:phosphate transport system protein